jgi:hypothetical protein
MEKTVEFEVAETSKLCIELDEKTKKLWEETRESLEYKVQHWFKEGAKASNIDVLRYLLTCLDTSFVDNYVNEILDVKVLDSMHRRYTKYKNSLMLNRCSTKTT